ncbi:hypothetical protein [Microbacterium maritypicum]|uniref:Uncharacterized protein n=1 Tax=Microbacterium maritypicum TaxID=33918 RepID=A0A4Y4B1G6_MICMQ|nr:hypothetical protein [Microbacterium liquefaciens]GEC74196.1 hypothetical protein MLI01_03410 [Microbacterium liquefaciens]GGV49569.1 hypothetical protein GCM10010213_03420 [Microbacterium liquefaciens]
MTEDSAGDANVADLDVDADEFILRALDRHDVNGSKQVKWQAMAPAQTESISSVMRLRLLGPDAAKAEGIRIKGPKFVGFGRALASTYLRAAQSIEDSREEFHGHADLDHGFRRPPTGEPLLPGEPADPSDEYQVAVFHYRGIANALCYFEDATPAPTWAGADLAAACAKEGCADPCPHP